MTSEREFCVPGLGNAEAADVLRRMHAAGHHPLYSITYLHDGNRYTATVGEERIEYLRRTGPRGGYIKEAEPVAHGRPTGSKVLLIARTESVIEVHSMQPPRGWVNPSMIGLNEVERIISFTDA